MADAASPTDRRTRWLIAIGLMVLVLACFWPVVTFDFINYDDNRYVTANRVVLQGWSEGAWSYSWRSLDGGYWHPLTWWTHLTDVTLFGRDARGHHATNLLIHLANTILLWWVLTRYTGFTWPSAWAAAVFGIHPMHVESVAWISERKDVLSGLFFLLTLLAYRRYVERPSIASYLWTTAALVGALLSKPMAVTIPAVLLLLDVWPLGRLGLRGPGSGVREKSRSRNPIREKLPWFAMAIALGVFAITNAAAVGDLRASDAIPLSVRVQTMLLAYARYLGKLIWPSHLSLFYPYPASWPLPWVIGAAVLLAVISAIAIWQLKRRPAVFVGWCWYLGVLLPISGIVLVSDASIAERYTYLPYIGLTIAIAWGVAGVLPRRAVAVAGVVSVIALALLCSRQVWVWQDSLTVWAAALKSDPDNWTANLNYAVALADARREDEAGPYFQHAVEVEPNVALLNTNYARWLLDRGRTAEAEPYLAKAGPLDPSFGDYLSLSGRLQYQQGRPDAAIPLLVRAIQRSPTILEARLYLAQCEIDLGWPDQAEKHLNEALQLEPNSAAACRGLAKVAIARNHPAEAAKWYARAIAADPADVQARLGYAELAVEAQNPREAGPQLGMAERLATNPLDQARVALLKGQVLEQLARPMDAAGQFLQSIELLRGAIAARPGDPAAHYQLAVTLQQLGRTDEADQAAREAMAAAQAADHRWNLLRLRARFPSLSATRPASRP